VEIAFRQRCEQKKIIVSQASELLGSGERNAFHDK
jgi:hypothetical protein